MSPHQQVVRRAPGKLFVAGEYAVVDAGNPSVLVAVDRYVTVTVSPLPSAHPGTDLEISSDLGPRGVRWQWNGDRLDPVLQPGRADGANTVRTALAHVVAAIETVAALAAEHGLPRPGFALDVESGLHEGGTKYGLGSSGAVTVATVAATAAFWDLPTTIEDRYRLAMLATARLTPRASGGDLAASTWGGWVAYQAPDRPAVLDLARRHGTGEALRAPWPGLAVRRLPAPAGLTLHVGWTGNPASTVSLVSDLDKRRNWRGSPAHHTFVANTTDCVRALIDALEHHDRTGPLDHLRRARQELARLDDEVGLGVFTPKLTALCEAAEALGGAAKPSGAGGGDCGIALFPADAAHDIAQVQEKWAAAGVLPLPIRPAPEGNEE